MLTSMADRPAVLISGGPLSGKSTLSRAMAARAGAPAMGLGTVVRRRASELGLTVEELTLRLTDAEHARLDLDLAQAIAGGQAAVFESRLAVHIGAWLRHQGRSNLVLVTLECPDAERARRSLDRDAARSAKSLQEAADSLLRREREERERLARIYGFDFGVEAPYDIRIDTGTTTVEAAVAQIMRVREEGIAS